MPTSIATGAPASPLSPFGPCGPPGPCGPTGPWGPDGPAAPDPRLRGHSASLSGFCPLAHWLLRRMFRSPLEALPPCLWMHTGMKFGFAAATAPGDSSGDCANPPVTNMLKPTTVAMLVPRTSGVLARERAARPSERGSNHAMANLLTSRTRSARRTTHRHAHIRAGGRAPRHLRTRTYAQPTASATTRRARRQAI